MTHEMKMLTLDRLRPGQDHKPPVNIRSGGYKDSDIDQLAVSLVEHGQIYPFIVVAGAKGFYYVADGGRRLEAQRKRNLPNGIEFECKIVPLEEALELSLATAETVLPPHEADRYVAFRDVAAKSENPVASITTRFGVTERYAKRVLALGALSPKVVDAWRADQLGNRAADVVRVLTLVDIPAQEKALGKFPKSEQDRQYLSAHQVRSMLGLEGSREQGKHLKFVGVDAYKAAGGTITEDLFGEDHVVNDPTLLKEVADKKLCAKVEELREAGWSWVDTDSNIGSARWSMAHHPQAKGEKTPIAARQKSGCVVGIGGDGAWDIAYGLIKGRAVSSSGSSTKKKGKAKDEPKPEVSNALMERLSKAATLAGQDAIILEPKVAVAAMLACLSSRSYGKPLRVERHGYVPENADHPGAATRFKETAFKEPFEQFLKMNQTQIGEMIARAMAPAIDFRSYDSKRGPLAGDVGLMLAQMAPRNINAALLRRFDAGDYFQSAKRDRAIAAIRECLGDAEARTADKMKGAQLKGAAEKAIKDKGWLPPELRTATYTGPGSAKPTVRKRK